MSGLNLYRHSASTPRRIVTAILWYLATSTAASAALFASGQPMDGASLVGLAVGILVYADPLYVLWGRRRVTVADLPTVEPAAAGDPGVVALESRSA